MQELDEQMNVKFISSLKTPCHSAGKYHLWFPTPVNHTYTEEELQFCLQFLQKAKCALLEGLPELAPIRELCRKHGLIDSKFIEHNFFDELKGYHEWIVSHGDLSDPGNLYNICPQYPTYLCYKTIAMAFMDYNGSVKMENLPVFWPFLLTFDMLEMESLRILRENDWVHPLS